MSTDEHTRKWQELMKNMSMGRKSQPEAQRKISQSEEERKLWMEEDEGNISSGSGARKETLWPRTSLEVSNGKFILAGLQRLLERFKIARIP